jgi:RNA-directed DNA polymerase
MHENRETSELSARGSGADRPEKADSRMTGVNGAEESDCAVVPVNEPNKGEPSRGDLSAEVGEGEAWTEENTSQAHTNPTQGGKKGVSQGLAGVRQAARARKGERFTALLHQLTLELLRASFYALKREAAAGVDGVKWREYEAGLEGRLADLHSRVHRGAYWAQPSRRVYIPKADGRQRPLGVAALEDKIVQHAVVTILKEIYENDFLGFSYGFRPGRSQHQALDALTVGIRRKRVNWVLDLDIRGFYDNMVHEWINKFVAHRVGDPRVLRLIQKWLKAGVSEDGAWSESKVGTPQGAVISPLLANLYLHYAIDLWVEAWRREVARGAVIVVRYADDVVLGFEHKEEAERFQRALRERLGKFGLELHREKRRLQAKLQAVKEELRKRMHEPIGETGKWLAKVVRGYYRYHAVPENLASLGLFRERLLRLWRHGIRRRSQKRPPNWDRLGRYFDRWLPRPCVLHPFPHVRFDASHPR